MDNTSLIPLLAVGVTIISGIVTSTWYLGFKIGNLSGEIQTVKDNHLPHIDLRLNAVDTRLNTIEKVLMEKTH